MGGVGSGATPKVYPPEIIALAVGLYEAGCTIKEVQDALPKGHKAQRIIARYVPTRRSTAKRNQRGPANHMWKQSPSYGAVHLRLGSVSDHECLDCGKTAQHWSYRGECGTELTDKSGRAYCVHPHHYAPRCVKCHHEYDYKGRRPNGQFVSREEVMPYV